jgi:pimeloyl-ACP methyl ester carboxylesterase
LRRFFQLCRDAGEQRCAFAAGADPRRKYAALADRLKATPLEVPVPGQPPYPVGYADLVAVSTSALYGSWSWPALGRVLQALYVRDARAAAAAAAEITPPPAPGYDNYIEANLAINCADTDNPRNPRRYGRVGQRRDRTVAPYAGSRWAYFSQPCAAWQGRSTERHTGPWTARTTNPVLLLNNRYDPATPYRSAVKVHRLLPNSSLVTVNDVGHGAMFNSCASAAVTRYLLSGATPAAGTVCPADAAPFAPEPATASRRGEPTAAESAHAAIVRSLVRGG